LPTTTFHDNFILGALWDGSLVEKHKARKEKSKAEKRIKNQGEIL
jgi:hypothetical protein